MGRIPLDPPPGVGTFAALARWGLARARGDADRRLSTEDDDSLPPGEALAAAFRTAMRRHVAGVCVLSAGAGERVNGMVVTAATSFSLEPPSVLVCVNASASISADLAMGSRFGLTLLGAAHEGVAAAFARTPPGPARFVADGWSLASDGPPRLEGAPAQLLCRVVRELAYGSHRALVGEVEQVMLGPDGGSLLYRDGAYA